MNNLTNDRLDYMRSLAGKAVTLSGTELAAVVNRLLAAEAQLAELRGQEPVAFYAKGAYYNTTKAAIKDGASEIEELYALPVPPAASQPDAMLCDFYEVDSYPDLVRELVLHVEQLQESAKRNVKPWEDTFPETLLPAYIERIKNADDAVRAASSAIPPAASQPYTVPDDYQHLKNVQELYHSQEKRLFSIAKRIKGESFDKYAYSPSQAIDALEAAIFGEDVSCRAAMLQSGNPPVLPDGWALVPVEADADMSHAGHDYYQKSKAEFGDFTPTGMYRAMLSAAPQHKGE